MKFSWVGTDTTISYRHYFVKHLGRNFGLEVSNKQGKINRHGGGNQDKAVNEKTIRWEEVKKQTICFIYEIYDYGKGDLTIVETLNATEKVDQGET